MAGMVTRVRVERGRRVSVALSPTELCVAEPVGPLGVPTPRRVALEAPAGDGAAWPSLSAALQELARALGASESDQMVISLMPPLTEVRRLELPPLSDEELTRLVSRNAGRYFVGARVAQAVGTVPRSRRARSAGAPVVAAAVASRLMATIHTAAREAGWTVECVVPAEAAWVASVPVLWPDLGKRDAHLLVHHDERTDLLKIEDGRLANVRRFRAGELDADLIAEAVTAPERSAPADVRLASLGDAARRRELAGALESRGIVVAGPPPQWAGACEAPDLIAAAFGGATTGPLLRSEDAQVVHRLRERRTLRALIGATAGLLVLAAAFDLWGVRRQLAAVEAQRAVLKPEIAATLVGRTSVETAFRRLAELMSAERSAPHWSSVIASFSEHLSDDAYLTGFRARADSVTVDGLSVRAARVFDDIELIPGLTGVRAAAPVRREAEDHGEAREHFTITARVAGSPPATTAPATVGKGAP